jgi:hypothetical protein
MMGKVLSIDVTSVTYFDGYDNRLGIQNIANQAVISVPVTPKAVPFAFKGASFASRIGQCGNVVLEITQQHIRDAGIHFREVFCGMFC